MSNTINKEILDPKNLIDVVIGGIDTRDYPDFADAYLESANLVVEGVIRELNDDELDYISWKYPGFILESALDVCF